jgi:hypothetical protein
MAEYAFMTELGIGDPKLIGYVVDLLSGFVASQRVWRLRDQRGERLTDVAAMVAEAESSLDDNRRRECHRHVGDYTLFWTGVYPEAIARLKARGSSDHLIDYQQQGKRSYYLASTFASAEAPILRRLSEQFELCAFGLSRVRHEWEKLEAEAPHQKQIPPGLLGL